MTDIIFPAAETAFPTEEGVRQAIELAIAGASKVIEKNLDDESNRKIVETFLASIPVTETKRG